MVALGQVAAPRGEAALESPSLRIARRGCIAIGSFVWVQHAALGAEHLGLRIQ